jgi:hypothetical protein
LAPASDEPGRQVVAAIGGAALYTRLDVASEAGSSSARPHYLVNLTNNAAKLTVNFGADFDVFA